MFETICKRKEVMEFTKDQLQVIESALEVARDNTGDTEWADEINSVLYEVRHNLHKKANDETAQI